MFPKYYCFLTKIYCKTENSLLLRNGTEIYLNLGGFNEYGPGVNTNVSCHFRRNSTTITCRPERQEKFLPDIYTKWFVERAVFN